MVSQVRFSGWQVKSNNRGYRCQNEFPDHILITAPTPIDRIKCLHVVTVVGCDYLAYGLVELRNFGLSGEGRSEG